MKTLTPDLSGIVHPHPSADHLNGALVRIGRTDHVVTARHLGMQGGQRVIIAGQDYTIANVRGIDLACTGPRPAAEWRDDRLLNGDLAIATLREEVPPGVTRYPIAGQATGTGYMLRPGEDLLRFPYQRHASFRNWLRGSFLRPLQFREGDSGRPILALDRHGRTVLVSVLSRIWWGEWPFLRPQHLTTFA
jgi:hypothetical protein